MTIFQNSLVKRTVSGVIMLILLLGSVLLSPYTFLLLLLVITVFSMHEFFALSAASNQATPLKIYTILIGCVMVVTNFLVFSWQLEFKYAYVSVLLLFTLFIIELYRKAKDPLTNIAVEIASLAYIAVPMTLLGGIPFQTGDMAGGTEYVPMMVLGYVFIVWANDVGAFLVGISIGKHRLFERISPKKSWEGFFGGLFFAVALGAIIGHYCFDEMVLWGLLGLIVSVTGVFGDLVESLFKRVAGVKDSGNTIPGHGGFLDRFDAMFISAPFVFGYLLLTGNL